MLVADHLSLGIPQFHLEGRALPRQTTSAYGHHHGGLVVFQFRRTYEGLPRIYPVWARHDECHRTVDSSSWVPARTLLHILQIHLQQIIPRLHKRCEIHAEGIVAIRPVARLLAIKTDDRLRHRTVEHQFRMTAVRWDGDDTPVVSLSDPWQGTRASALLRGLRLTVLFDGHPLQVPFLVERSGDGPVVGHTDGLPRLFVVGELPPVAEDGFLTVLGCGA